MNRASTWTVRKAELRRLAGDELGGAPRPLTRTDFDVETGLLVEAFVLRNQETGIRPLVKPVEPHGHLPLHLRVPTPHKRGSGKAGRDADLT
jgi:hypothetical protein